MKLSKFTIKTEWPSAMSICFSEDMRSAIDTILDDHVWHRTQAGYDMARIDLCRLVLAAQREQLIEESRIADTLEA